MNNYKPKPHLHLYVLFIGITICSFAQVHGQYHWKYYNRPHVFFDYLHTDSVMYIASGGGGIVKVKPDLSYTFLRTNNSEIRYNSPSGIEGLPNGNLIVTFNSYPYSNMMPIGGLQDFNGSVFSNFKDRNDANFPSNLIEQLHVDNQGDIWFGFYNTPPMPHGIAKISNGVTTVFQASNSGFQADGATCFGSWNNQVLVGTSKGIYTYENNIWTLHDSTNSNLNAIPNAIATAPNGDTWIATNQGIFIYDGTQFTLHNPIGLPGNPIDNFLDIYYSGDSLVLASVNKLYLKNTQGWILLKELPANNTFGKSTIDKQGRIWTTFEQTCHYFQNNQWTPIIFKDENLVPGIFTKQDELGYYWSASHRNIYRYDSNLDSTTTFTVAPNPQFPNEYYGVGYAGYDTLKHEMWFTFSLSGGVEYWTKINTQTLAYKTYNLSSVFISFAGISYPQTNESVIAVTDGTIVFDNNGAYTITPSTYYEEPPNGELLYFIEPKPGLLFTSNYDNELFYKNGYDSPWLSVVNASGTLPSDFRTIWYHFDGKETIYLDGYIPVQQGYKSVLATLNIYDFSITTLVDMPFEPFQSFFYSQSVLDKNNNFWTIGYSENKKGLFMYDGHEWHDKSTLSGAITDDPFASLLADNDNCVWLMTWYGSSRLCCNNPTATNYFKDSYIICEGTEIQIVPEQTNAGFMDWGQPGKPIIPNGYVEEGEYEVKIKNEFGCYQKENFSVDFGGRIYTPNAFTTNDDGLNEIFKSIGNYDGEYSMSIYNRMGQLIYETQDITQGWDGTRQGKQEPQGMYLYILRYEDCESGLVMKKGLFSKLF